MNTIEIGNQKWDKKRYQEFKDRYAKARENAEEAFDFHGDTFMTDYAKYLIEFLDKRMEND